MPDNETPDPTQGEDPRTRLPEGVRKGIVIVDPVPPPIDDQFRPNLDAPQTAPADPGAVQDSGGGDGGGTGD